MLVNTLRGGVQKCVKKDRKATCSIQVNSFKWGGNVDHLRRHPDHMLNLFIIFIQHHFIFHLSHQEVVFVGSLTPDASLIWNTVHAGFNWPNKTFTYST